MCINHWSITICQLIELRSTDYRIIHPNRSPYDANFSLRQDRTVLTCGGGGQYRGNRHEPTIHPGLYGTHRSPGFVRLREDTTAIGSNLTTSGVCCTTPLGATWWNFGSVSSIKHQQSLMVLVWGL